MRIQRGELTDLYVEGERSVVMIGENVLVLSEIATRIVSTVPETSSIGIEHVTAAVIESFGEPDPPASARDLTHQQVWDLVAHGVLAIEETEAEQRRTLRDTDALADQTRQRVAAVDALRGALSHLRSNNPVAWSLPSGLAPGDLVAVAHRHHVVPFFAANLDRLALPSRTAAELSVAASRSRVGAGFLAADLARALDALDSAGVSALAFKGVTLAAQAYGDFAVRGAGDLDLLVRPTDLETAHDALTRAGWVATPGSPSPGASWGWRHFVRTGNELALTNAHSMIDLHWHLTPTRGTFPPFDVLWSRREVVEVDGHGVPTLSRYDALAHSAGHAAKDHWRWLRSLVDVHHLAAQRETWESADRPLRDDQLITVGLAARTLGRTDDMPPVIDTAVELTDQVWQDVLERQAGASAAHTSLRVPGHNFARHLRTTSRTGGAPKEALRLLSRSAMPPWLTVEEPSPHAAVAVPRVLTRRARELLAKGRAAGR